MTIELRAITRKNFYHVIRLKVHDAQKMFVAPNAVSIAEAQFYEGWEPLAIYHADELVGFVMWGSDDRPIPPEYWIIRLMIDKAHQGQGYGRAATQAVMRRIIARTGCDAIFLSFEPENAGARQLYANLGFVDTGRVEEGEIVYRYAVPQKE